MEPRSQLQTCLDLISRDPVIFGSKKFFVAAEGEEEKTESLLNFPLPKDADIAGFLKGNSGSDGRAYKRGIIGLVNELKEWIKNNKAGSEGELDIFLRRYGKYDGDNKEQNGIMLPLLQEGIPLLKKIVNFLVQYPLEISRSGEPQPKDMQKNKVYLYGEGAKLFFKAKKSKESVEIKPEDLDEDLYKEILGVLNDPVANLNEKQERALYKITAQHGFPPPPDERKLDRQKAVIKNLVESLYVCAPGCHTNIFDAYLALSTDPYEVMMEYRKNIIQQYLIEAIEPYTKQFKENGDKVLDPGMIIHYANMIMKKHEHPLGLKVINDTFGHFCNPATLLQVEKDVFNRLLIQEGEKNPNGAALNQAVEGISDKDREKLTAELFKAQFTMDKVLEFAMRRCDLNFLDKKLAKSPCEITVMDEFPTNTETDWQVKYKGRHILLKANGTDRRNPVLYWIEYANRPVEKAIKFKDQDGFNQEIKEYLKDNPKTLRLSAEQAENLLTKNGGGVAEVQASVAQHAIDDFKADLNLYGADSVPFEMDKLYEIDVIEVDVVNQEKPTSQARYLPKPDATDNLQVSMLERLERLDFLQLAGVKLGPEQTDELQLYTFNGKDVHYAYVEEQISNTRFRSSLIDYIWEKIAEDEEEDSEEAEQAMSKLKPEQQIELLQGLQEYIAILAKQQKWNPQGLEDLAKKVKLILSNDNINALLTGNRTIGINILASLPEEYYPRLWPLVTGEEWLLKAESKGPFVLFETLNKYERDNKEKTLKLIENLAPESRAKVIKYLSEAKGELESKFFKSILGRSFPALYEAFFKSMDTKTQNESLLAMWGHFLTKDPSTKFHLEPEDKSIFFRLIEISSSEAINEFLEKEQEGGSLLSQIFKFMNFDTVYFDRLLSKTSYANIVDTFFSKEETFKPRDDLIRLLTLPRTIRGVQPEWESKEESAKEEKSRTLNFILQLVYKLPQDLRNFSHYQELLASVGLSLDDIKLNLPQAEINFYLASVLALVEPHKRLGTLLDMNVEIKDLGELVLFGKNLNLNDLDIYMQKYPLNTLFRDDQRLSPSIANKLNPDSPFKAMKTKPQEVAILLTIVLQNQGRKFYLNKLIVDQNLNILWAFFGYDLQNYSILDRNLPAFQAYAYQMLSLASPGASIDVFLNHLGLREVSKLGSKNMEILLAKASKEVIRAKLPFYLGLSSKSNQLIKEAHGLENYKKFWEDRLKESSFVESLKQKDEDIGRVIRILPSDLCLEALQIFKANKISWFSIFSQCTENEFSGLMDSVGPEWIKSLLNLDGDPNFLNLEMKVNEENLELTKKNIDTLIEKVTSLELSKVANCLCIGWFENLTTFKIGMIQQFVKKIQSETPTALHKLPPEKFTELMRAWLELPEDLYKPLIGLLNPNQVKEFIKREFAIEFSSSIKDPKKLKYLINMLDLGDREVFQSLLAEQEKTAANPFFRILNKTKAEILASGQDFDEGEQRVTADEFIESCADLAAHIKNGVPIGLSDTEVLVNFNSKNTEAIKVRKKRGEQREVESLSDFCWKVMSEKNTNLLSLFDEEVKFKIIEQIKFKFMLASKTAVLTKDSDARKDLVNRLKRFFNNNEIQGLLTLKYYDYKNIDVQSELERIQVTVGWIASCPEESIDELLSIIVDEESRNALHCKGILALIEYSLLKGDRFVVERVFKTLSLESMCNAIEYFLKTEDRLKGEFLNVIRIFPELLSNSVRSASQKLNGDAKGLEDLSVKLAQFLSIKEIQQYMMGEQEDKRFFIEMILELPQEQYPMLIPLVTGENWYKQRKYSGLLSLFEYICSTEKNYDEIFISMVRSLYPQARVMLLESVIKDPGGLGLSVLKNIFSPALENIDLKTKNVLIEAMWNRYLSKEIYPNGFKLPFEGDDPLFTLIEMSPPELINDFLNKNVTTPSLLVQIYTVLLYNSNSLKRGTHHLDKLRAKLDYVTIKNAFFTEEIELTAKSELREMLNQPWVLTPPEEKVPEEVLRFRKARFMLDLAAKFPEDQKNAELFPNLLKSIGISSFDISKEVPDSEKISFLAALFPLIEPNKRCSTVEEAKPVFSNVQELCAVGKNIDLYHLQDYLASPLIEPLIKKMRVSYEMPFEAMKDFPEEVPIRLAIYLSKLDLRLGLRKSISNPNLNILRAIILESDPDFSGSLAKYLPDFRAYINNIFKSSSDVALNEFFQEIEPNPQLFEVLGPANTELLLTKTTPVNIGANNPVSYLGIAMPSINLIKSAFEAKEYEEKWENNLSNPYSIPAMMNFLTAPDDSGEKLLSLMPIELQSDAITLLRSYQKSWISILSQYSENEFKTFIEGLSPDEFKSLLNADEDQCLIDLEFKFEDDRQNRARTNIYYLLSKVPQNVLEELRARLNTADLTAASPLKVEVIQQLMANVRLPAEEVSNAIRSWLNTPRDLCKSLMDLFEPNQIQEFIRNEYLIQFCLRIHDPKGRQYLKNMLSLADHDLQIKLLSAQAGFSANPFYTFASQALDVLISQDAEADDFLGSCESYINQCADLVSSSGSIPLNETVTIINFYHRTSITKIMVEENNRQMSLFDFCQNKILRGNTNILSILSTYQKDELFEMIQNKLEMASVDLTSRLRTVIAFYSNNEVQAFLKQGEGDKGKRIARALKHLENFSAEMINTILPLILEEGRFKQLKLKGKSAILECMLQDGDLSDVAFKFKGFDIAKRTSLLVNFRMAGGKTFENMLRMVFNDEKVIPSPDQFQEFINNKFAALFASKISDPGSVSFLQNLLTLADETFLRDFLTMQASLPANPFYSLARASLEKLSNFEAGQSQSAEVAMIFIQDCSKCIETIDLNPGIYPLSATEKFSVFDGGDISKMKVEQTIDGQKVEMSFTDYCWEKMSNTNTNLFSILGRQQKVDVLEHLLRKLQEHPLAHSISPDDRGKYVGQLKRFFSNNEIQALINISRYPSFDAYGDKRNLGRLARIAYGLGFMSACPEEAKDEILALYIPEMKNKGRLALFEYALQDPDTDAVKAIFKSLPFDIRIKAIEELNKREIGAVLLLRFNGIHGTLYMIQDLAKEIKDEPSQWEELATKITTFLSLEEVKKTMNDDYDNFWLISLQMLASLPEVYCAKLLPLIAGEEWSKGSESQGYLALFEYLLHRAPDDSSSTLDLLKALSPDLRATLLNSLSQAKGGVERKLLGQLSMIGFAFHCGLIQDDTIFEEIYSTLFEKSDFTIKNACLEEIWKSFLTKDDNEYGFEDMGRDKVTTAFCKLIEDSPRELLNKFLNADVDTPSLLTRIYPIIFAESRKSTNPEAYLNGFLAKLNLQTIKNSSFYSSLDPENMEFINKMEEEKHETKAQAIETETPHNIDHAAESIEKLLHDLHTLVMPKQTSTLFAHNVSSLRGDLGGVVNQLEVACKGQYWIYARDSVQRLYEYEKDKPNDSLHKLVEKLQTAIAIEISKAPTVAPKAPEVPKEPRVRGGGHGNIAGG